MADNVPIGLASLAGPFAPSDSCATSEPVTPEHVLALVYRQMRVLAGHRDVEELAQVAAEQAIRGLAGFEGRAKLSTWTFRICYLTVRKHDRSLRRWLRRFSLTDDGELPDAATSECGPDERVLREERVARLRAALDGLSPKRRSVVILHDLEGLDIGEVAQIVGAHPRAVRSRLRDGRSALAARLAADPYFGAEACRKECP